MTVNEEADLLFADCQDYEDALEYIDDSVDSLVEENPQFDPEEVRKELLSRLKELYNVD